MKHLALACLVAAIPLPVVASQDAEELILCSNEDDSTVVVELWKPSSFDEKLHCIRADFMVDAETCAPNGGWGLNSDDGVSKLVGITSDWKTAHKHLAAKMTAISGPKAVIFNAQHGVGIGNNLSYEWKFSLDRRTGDAIWYRKDGQKVLYSCDVQS